MLTSTISNPSSLDDDERKKSFLGLLDLKKEAVIGLDGQTICLKRDDFVGVRNLPSDELHFVTVRSQPNATVAVGFFLFREKALVRRYDPQTEEISSQLLDEITVQNLLQHVEQQSQPQTSPQILDYSAIVSITHQQEWKYQTHYITTSNILKMRGINSGDKVVPGSYHPDEGEMDLSSVKTNKLYPKHQPLQKQDAIDDGDSISYPSIPVVDPNLSLWKNRHPGTTRYLSRLDPAERTALFMEPRIGGRLLQDVLAKYYHHQWQNLLGDMQLAYISFLYLHCFSSLEHWKDLVAMVSLVESEGAESQSELYRALLNDVLPSQISTMERGFLEDIDEAGNNFLLPSLRKLCAALSKTTNVVGDDSLAKFQKLLANKFPGSFQKNEEANNYLPLLEDDEDEDAPVVVAVEDVQASLTRSSPTGPRQSIPKEIQNSYPMLVAAMMPHEDILMTCARALDEQTDVSLVREAASYLEDVEQKT